MVSSLALFYFMTSGRCCSLIGVALADFFHSWEASEVRNVPTLDRVINKRTLSGARRIVQEYTKVWVLLSSGSVQMLCADENRQYTDCYAIADAAGDNGGNSQLAPNVTTAGFESKFALIVASQTNTGGVTPLALGDVLFLVFRNSKAMNRRLQDRKDAKDLTQKRILVVEID